MKKQLDNKIPIGKITLAVIISTLISTVLLIGIPQIFLLIFFLIIIPLTFIIRIPTENYDTLIVIAVYTIGIATILLPGIILNFIITQSLLRKFKVISMLLFLFLFIVIAYYLSGSIISRMDNLNFKV